MSVNPAELMSGFHEDSWNVQNTIRGLPAVVSIMLSQTHENGTPLWQKVEFPDRTFTHPTVEHWIKSSSRAGMGMKLSYLFHCLDAHDELKGHGSADKVRKLLEGHGITVTSAVVKDSRVLSKVGRPTKGQNKVDNINNTNGGTSVAYLAGILKRDHPKIAAALERGEFKSVRAAAIAAGIIKVVSSLDQLRRAWKRASAEEREAFELWKKDEASKCLASV